MFNRQEGERLNEVSLGNTGCERRKAVKLGEYYIQWQHWVL